MTEGLADTSVFIAHESGRTLRSDLLPDRLAVSVITVGELRAGVLAATDLATRDLRLATLTAVHRPRPGARGRGRRRGLGAPAGHPPGPRARMGINDSWIAATAIALDVPLVTQDDGFEDVPPLRVIRV